MVKDNEDNIPNIFEYNEEEIDEMNLRKKPTKSRKQIANEEGI